MDEPFCSLLLPLSTTPFPPPPLISCPRKPYLDFHLPRQTRLQSFLCLASSSVPSSIKESAIQLEDRKFELLRTVADTKRGLITTTHQRSSMEEALIDAESLDAGKPIDLFILDGTWRLQYTSAPVVLILLQSAAILPFFEVDQIFQSFAEINLAMALSVMLSSGASPDCWRNKKVQPWSSLQNFQLFLHVTSTSSLKRYQFRM